MRANGRGHLWSGLAGGLIAALLVMGVPAVADPGPATSAVLNPGDPLQAGRVNDINRTTWLRGNAPNGNLRIRNTGAGPALDLIVPGGEAPLTVNSKTRVPLLNVDRVDNRHANELIRVEHTISPEIDEAIFNGSSAADLLTLHITAPRRGTLVIGAGTDASGAADDHYTCTVKLNGFLVPGANRTARVHWFGLNHTDNSQEDCHTTTATDVDAGTHKIDFHVFGRNTVAFHSAALWVMYVPFDGTGAVPIP